MAGVAFKKTFSYAGFEMQPKKYKNPKIALLNVELELKAEKDNAEIRVHTVEVGNFLDEGLLSLCCKGQLCFSGDCGHLSSLCVHVCIHGPLIFSLCFP